MSRIKSRTILGIILSIMAVFLYNIVTSFYTQSENQKLDFINNLKIQDIKSIEIINEKKNYFKRIEELPIINLFVSRINKTEKWDKKRKILYEHCTIKLILIDKFCSLRLSFNKNDPCVEFVYNDKYFLQTFENCYLKDWLDQYGD